MRLGGVNTAAVAVTAPAIQKLNAKTQLFSNSKVKTKIIELSANIFKALQGKTDITKAKNNELHMVHVQGSGRKVRQRACSPPEAGFDVNG